MNSAPLSIMTILAIPFAALSSLFLTEASFAQANFSDVGADYWAKPYIETLAKEEIIKGFPDGSFRPNEPVTRAQFAALIRTAFNRSKQRTSDVFADVKADHWARTAINHAYTTGFLSGYPDKTFAPEQPIPKVQALVALASGLDLGPIGSVDQVLAQFSDQAQIPSYARPSVAAATQRQITVNYPQVSQLRPQQQASRADIAAYLYQSLVTQGTLRPIAPNSPTAQYIVPALVVSDPSQFLTKGTDIPVVIPGFKPETTLIMAVGESFEMAFTVAEDVETPQGAVIIPQGSIVSGHFERTSIHRRREARFKAKTLTIGNQPREIQATSASFLGQRNHQVTVNDVVGNLSTTAAASVLNPLLYRMVNTAEEESTRVGIKLDLTPPSDLPTIVPTAPTQKQKRISKDEVILVKLDQMGLALDSNFPPEPAIEPTISKAGSQVTITSGTQLRLSSPTPETKYLALLGETFPIELVVAKTLYRRTPRKKQVVIPKGSLIRGLLKPTGQSSGAVFKAEELVLKDQTYLLEARTEEIVPQDVQSLGMEDFHGIVEASPKASAAWDQVPSSGAASELIEMWLGGPSNSNAQVIIFDPATMTLELNADLILQSQE